MEDSFVCIIPFGRDDTRASSSCSTRTSCRVPKASIAMKTAMKTTAAKCVPTTARVGRKPAPKSVAIRAATFGRGKATVNAPFQAANHSQVRASSSRDANSSVHGIDC